MEQSLKQATLEAVQEACTPRAWQLGKKLFEDGLVELVSDGGVQEQVFRVWAPGRPVAPTTTLYVEDEEWDCDCPSRLDACEHAAAAAHALLAAPKAAETAATAGPHLGYRLHSRRGGLVLERAWISETGEAPLTQRLGARKAGVQGGFSPREHDLKIEQLLIATQGKVLPLETMASLFGWLEKSEDVQLDYAPVRVSSVAPMYRATLRASGEGYALRIDAPLALEAEGHRRPGDAVVAAGVVQINKTLHPLTHLRLVGSRLESLPIERRFEGEAVVELVSELLPQLQKGMDFDRGGVDLPRLVEGMDVGLELTVRVRADGLELIGAVTYGDPPVAHLRGDRLFVEGSRWPKRNRRAEAQAAHRLQSRFEIEPGERRVARGPAAVELAAKLRAYKGRLLGRAQLGHFGLTLAPQMRTREDGVTELHFVAGERRVSVDDALAAWRANESGLSLPGGGYAELPQEFMQAQAERLEAFIAASRGGARLPAHALGTVAQLCEALECPLPPSFERLRPLVEDFDGLPAATLPADLQATLRTYQRRGVDWLAFARSAGLGAMLCDDMGLGKTVQALCAMQDESLVVAPRSLLHNWSKEAARFRPELEVVVYHGAGRELPPARRGVQRLVITSYGVMRLDVEALAQHPWSMIVLDEAQTIKNPDSQVARAAFELEAPFKVTLSGTPVENRLDELWSQAHFTNPGMLGGLEEFKDLYARPIAAGDQARAAMLRGRLRPILLRRLKREVAPELPPRIEVTVHCELSDDERTLYEALRLQARAQVESLLEGGKSVMSVLETLLRLRQAACHGALVPGQSPPDSAKMRRLRTELDEAVAAGHKALVFSQWTSLLDLVEPGLDALGIDFCRLDGSTRDRAGVVDAFSADDGPPVMLLSLMAGGTGLNLVAADHVYFLDPWWNPAVEAQAADRAHRIGQDKPVIIHRLVASNTVDERILALQERKRALADAVVAEGGGPLTREDLFELLA